MDLKRARIEVSGRLPGGIGLRRAELRDAAAFFAERSASRVGVPFREVAVVLQGDADSASSGCALYEVKHSLSRTPDQTRHLRDEEMLSAAKSRFGQITERTVLYRGEDFDDADGIQYRNAENYLASLV